MKNKLIFPLITTFLLSIIVSCPPPIAEGGGITGKGALTIVFDVARIANRTLLPDIDMNPAGYIITGTGPDGASFEIETTDTTVVIEKLAFGDWTVVVEAQNSAEVIIGSGQGQTIVHTGQTAVVDITVTPLAGYGTLDLTVLWNAGDTDTPSIDSELIPSIGATQVLDFTVDAAAGQAVYTSDAIQTGYHTLIVKLLDNGLLTMGAVEVVRIVKDGVSEGTFEFYEINKPGGNIQVNITPDMADPLEVSMSGQVAELSQGVSMTVTASVTDDPGNVVYVWYINGESVGTGETITVGSDLDIGVYRLDVTAFTADGRRAGSTSAMFHVVEDNIGILYGNVAEMLGVGDNEEQIYPAVTVDPENILHVIYHDGSKDISYGNGIYVNSSDEYTVETDFGRVTGGCGEGSSISYDESTEIIHVLIPTINRGYGYDFHYANSGDFTDMQRITSLDEIAGRHEMFGEIKAQQGIAHCIWRMYNVEDGQPRGSRIIYGSSSDWSRWEYVRAPIFGTIDTFGPYVGESHLAIDVNNIVHTVWVDGALDNTIVYARSSDYEIINDPDPLVIGVSERKLWINYPTNIHADLNMGNLQIIANQDYLFLIFENSDRSIHIYESSIDIIDWQLVEIISNENWQFTAPRAVLRNDIIHIGFKGYNKETQENNLFYTSSDLSFAPKKIILDINVFPILNYGHNNNFDFRNGKAYFVGCFINSGSDWDVVIAVIEI